MADTKTHEIGRTPLERVNFLSTTSVAVWAKAEYLNPTGSHKDRAYASMIEELKRAGKVRQGMTLVDYSSGNGGAALARLAKIGGHKALVIVPAQMSADKIQQIESLGGRVKKIPSSAAYGFYGTEDMMRARLEAARIANENPSEYIFLDQGENPANKSAFIALGREIIDDLESKRIKPDVFLAGIGTGGTLSGTAHALRERYGSNIKIIGVEPAESPTIYARIHKTRATHAEHNLSGIGIGVREANLDLSLIDDVILVEQKEWQEMLHRANEAGHPIGKSSSADLVAVKKAMDMFPKAKNIVTVFFDGIEKYESEHLFNNEPQVQTVVHPEKIEAKYETAWSELFADKLFHLRTAPDPKLKRIVSLLKKNRAARVLSVPCGDFYNEKFLYKQGLKIEGLDISKVAIKKAKTVIKTRRLKGCTAKLGDVFKKKLPRNYYDAIIALDFSMHLSDVSLIAFIQKASDALKPDGLLLINFLSPEDDTFLLGNVVGPKVRSVREGKILIHYRDLFEIEELFSASPLVIEKSEPYTRVDVPHKGFREENATTHTHRGSFIVARKRLAKVEDVLRDVRGGKPIIVLDHREQEGDIYVASAKVTSKTINDMLSYGRGVLCVSLTPERFRELGLGSPSTWGTGYNETRFGDPVDYLIGTTTGVSAADRAATIKGLIAKETTPSDLRVPGHIRTLEAMSGGLRERSGHTEASIDLARLCGFYPSGVIIEVVGKDGTMAREPEILALAKKISIKVVRINQIKRYLLTEGMLS